MAFEKLKRTNYDHSGPHTAQDHHQDYEEYHQPLNRMQNSNFFDWGIVKGLNVTGSIGSTQLQVQPGVGIDAGGGLISLATGGQGDIGTNPFGTPPQNQLVAVPITLTTAGFHGKTVYITIQFSLFYSKSPTDPYDPGDYEQIPWVRLQDTALFVNDGSALILAKATIDGTGNITNIDGRDRKIVETSIGKLSLRKGNPATSSGAFDIKEDVTIEANGETGKLIVGAPGESGEVILKRHTDDETIRMYGSSGELHLGGNGADGDLYLTNANNQNTVRIDGSTANLYLGGNGADGDFFVRDGSGTTTASITGSTGIMKMKRIDPYGDVLDIDARYVRIHGWDLCLDGRSGNNKRALVDLNNRLVINYANDYENGVTVNGLHLSDHIKVAFWEEGSEWNPGRYEFHEFYKKNTHLKASEWTIVTMCEIGMYDKGTVKHFWWQTANASYINHDNEWVIKWDIEYGDNGTDWMPWYRAVCWIAFRK